MQNSYEIRVNRSKEPKKKGLYLIVQTETNCYFSTGPETILPLAKKSPLGLLIIRKVKLLVKSSCTE